nr:unnamed protein product [Naegleria fowleri]
MSVVRTLLLSILVILSLHQETPHNHHHHYHHHYFSIIGRVKAQTNVNSNTFIDKYLIPRPKEVTWEETATKLLSFYKLNFVLYVKGTKVDRTQFPVVDTALKRYEAWMFKLFETKGSPTNYDSDFLFYNEDVVIQITEDVTYPVLDVLNIDESYELTIRTRGIVIKSTSQFGFLRALETFSQMIRRNINDQFFFIPNTPIYIKDSPRFKHRGLMIDVARNYIYPETIKEIIDLMSFDKLNVLHIHFTDAQSFPYQMYGSFSDLSDKGSFSKELVYSKEDIASLIEYAYFRGIQIIPEFDMPGHTKSFSFAYPEVVSSCPKRLATNVNNYPLNVAESTTFDIIEAILGQWQSKDTLMEKTKISNSILLSIMHLGGDEVTKACWTDENPIIFNFFNAMQNQTQFGKIQNGYDIWGYFQAMIASKPNYQKLTTTIFWEDLFLSMAQQTTLFKPDPSKSICQIWRDPANIRNCVSQGYKTILSAGYYLDMINNPIGFSPNPNPPPYTFVDTWKSMYLIDPFDQFVNVSSSLDYVNSILGIEAALWAENVHDETIISTLYPRLTAFAERAWSDRSVKDLTDATTRLVNHRCHTQIKRGFKDIPPIKPIYCSYQYISEEPKEEITWAYGAAIAMFCINAFLVSMVLAMMIVVFCVYKKYASLKKAYRNDISMSEDKLNSYYVRED